MKRGVERSEESVVVLGLWAENQNRISLVKLLRRELGVGLAEAKSLMERNLESGEFIVIPVEQGRGICVAKEARRYGASCRVVAGEDAAKKQAQLREQTGSLSVSIQTLDVQAALVRVAPEMAIPALHFAEASHCFCRFVEDSGKESLAERFRDAARHLSALYAAALELPEVEPDADETEPAVAVPESWPGFGDAELYWEVFDPYEDEERVASTLSDDVLDVYSDIKRGLLHWQARRRLDAIWSWKFHFECHWGDHAVDGMRVIHRALRRLPPSV
ncbi:MAG: DUF5063 domain-containing protein [Polyangiales bacterium]